jgi:hypothetical protein
MPEARSEPMTAEDAMTEIWADICADCGPEDYAEMVAEVAAMTRYWHQRHQGNSQRGYRRIRIGAGPDSTTPSPPIPAV